MGFDISYSESGTNRTKLSRPNEPVVLWYLDPLIEIFKMNSFVVAGTMYLIIVNVSDYYVFRENVPKLLPRFLFQRLMIVSFSEWNNKNNVYI